MKMKKVLALLLCAVLLVTGSVLATLAYLTDTETVTNTFTVGDIVITLDEADVDDSDNDGNTTERDQANKYHLLPGTTVDKDPTVHVSNDSEDCYVYVKITNNLVGIESDDEGDVTIAAQMAANGWAVLDAANNIYVYVGTGDDADAAGKIVKAGADLVVFEKVYIDENVNNTTLAAYSGKTIEVIAYAIQSAGFENASAAWTAYKTQNP